jgi:hypothetical protein
MNLRNLAIYGVIIVVIIALYSVLNPSSHSNRRLILARSERRPSPASTVIKSKLMMGLIGVS